MRIFFQFNSTSSGQGVPEAIRLVKKYNGVLEGKFYKVEFKSPDDQNLMKFHELVGNLKGSLITMDDNEPIKASKFFNTFNCRDKLFCKGICTHARIGYIQLKQFNTRYRDKIENNILKTSETYILSSLSDFLEEKVEDEYKLDKKLALNYFLEKTEFEKKYCSIYDSGKIEAEIQKLPDEIKIVSPEELYEDRGYLEEHIVVINPENALLVNTEIDNDLSIKDILKISDALSIINFSNEHFLKLKDTDIRVYHNYDSPRYVLLKATEKNLEIEADTPGIVTRKEDLF